MRFQLRLGPHPTPSGQHLSAAAGAAASELDARATHTTGRIGLKTLGAPRDRPPAPGWEDAQARAGWSWLGTRARLLPRIRPQLPTQLAPARPLDSPSGSHPRSDEVSSSGDYAPSVGPVKRPLSTPRGEADRVLRLNAAAPALLPGLGPRPEFDFFCLDFIPIRPSPLFACAVSFSCDPGLEVSGV